MCLCFLFTIPCFSRPLSTTKHLRSVSALIAANNRETSASCLLLLPPKYPSLPNIRSNLRPLALNGCAVDGTGMEGGGQQQS